jgi:hypothetical protein
MSNLERAISHVASRCSGPPLPAGIAVTVHFHPDAPHRGRTALEALAAEGVYRSQFETGISNGALGGERAKWESRIFGGAYDDADPSLRPKYGALNHRRHVVGGSPRFGSSHLRLKPHVLARTTFCYPDSYFDPKHFGVAARMGLLALADAPMDDPLDSYIEAHVHGPLILADDVEAIVLDACYQDVGPLPCPVEWHPGFRMPIERRDPSYRGAEVAELARTLAVDGYLTPREIGLALQRGGDRTLLKRVWHCVARFGCPAC